MAEVFAALQHSLGREVAVKIMKDGDATLAERFQREARLVAALNHPHIVHIYDVGRLADGRPYLSMELLAGGDLRQRIREALPEADIRRIVRQLAEGLAAVHERGIVHRDIKPANILFRDNGDAVLSDFGIAKALDVDTELTQAGTVVGSPAYSSPEQVSAMPLDARSDLYSLGVVLLEMLTGRNPFRGPDYGSTVVNQLQLSPPALPPGQAHWQHIVDRLLQKEPARRYADARALLADLAVPPPVPGTRADDGDVTLVNRPVPAQPLRGMHRWRLLFLVVLALVAAGLLGWHYHQRDPQVEAWLALADERLAHDQLSSPSDDSAVFYFGRVLQRDAGNRRAKRGLARVADRYAALAAAARDKGALDQSQDYVDRGLELQPDDAELLALREQVRAARTQRRNGVKKFLNNLFGH